MKKIIFLMLTATSTLSLSAQSTKNYLDDSQLSRWVIDVNLLGGLSNQNYTLPNSTGNYLNALNANTGNLKFNNGYAYGADAQLGFFFGEKRHFGIGTGFMYLMQQGDAILDNFQIAYQATDFNGSTYRQVVTGHNIKENLSITNMNIPLMLKYKNRFSKRWGFTADAGMLYNVQMQNAYTTHAAFDYEAIYQFGQSGDGTKVPVYDNSPIPSVNDWMITKAEFLRNNPNGNIQDYFNAKRALGYNVGLNQAVTNTKGNVSYAQGNIGFMLQPSFSYFLSDFVALNFGAYYLFQPFKTTANSSYHITDGVGTYSSVLNNTTKVDNQSYGLNIGARFFFGKKHEKSTLAITSIDHTSPSACGLYDGSIALKGLSANQPVKVDYKLNDVQAVSYATTVQPDGQVKIGNLGAGSYTGIEATIKKQNAKAEIVTLYDPAMIPPTQVIANPTTTGACNGFVIFKGMQPGSSATIAYSLNGSAHANFNGIVDADRLLTMNGLCEGKYSNLVATIGKCTANIPDFILAAPQTKDAALINTTIVTNTTVENKTFINTLPAIDISTPMLFDVNLYVLHSDAYPVIEEAYREMKSNKVSILTIQGNADSTGLEAKNVPLSLNRALAVKHELTKRGIKPSRIITIGHGSQDPVATNKTYIGKQENRNAVMTITPVKNEKYISDK